jgi:hypothetical protein
MQDSGEDESERKRWRDMVAEIKNSSGCVANIVPVMVPSRG